MTSPTLPPPGRSAIEAARDLRAKADRMERHGAPAYAARLRDWAARILAATQPRYDP